MKAHVLSGRIPYGAGWLLAWCLLWPYALAIAADDASPAPAPPAVIAEIMDLAGISAQLELMPAGVLAGAASQMDPAQQQGFSEIVNRAFAPSLLRADMTEFLLKNYEEARFAALLTQLRSPLARRMTALEIAAARPEVVAERNAFMEKFAFNPAAAARRKLAQRLLESSNALEMMLAIQAQTMRTIFNARSALVPPKDRPSATQIETWIANVRAQSREAMHGEMLHSLLYIYRDVSEGDLEQYIAYYESPTGRWFTTLFGLAYGHILQGGTERMVEEIKRSKGGHAIERGA